MTEPVLRVEGLTKSFAGVRALDDVSLDVRPREVIGLIGENGAGKSTLLKVLAGVLRADHGRILVRGTPVKLANVAAAAAYGIGIVFQEQAVLPNVTVAENILLGHEGRAVRAGLYDWRTLYALAATQLDKLGARISPSALTATLSFGERQLIEIARALAIEERTRHEPIILFDEPTSMLDAGGIETVLGQIERLRQRASVVFVSHRLDEVLRVSDRICVMVNGRCVATRDRAMCSIADLERLMLGRELDGGYLQQSPSSMHGPKVRLSVHALGRRNSYQGVSFELHAGEVLGIAELAGSGGQSLCRTLFGVERGDTGEIVLDGRPVRLRGPSDAVRLGIGYVPAERRLEGIVGGLGICENMTLAHLDELLRGPFIDLAEERQLVKSWIERLRIRVPAADTPAHDLSGGNQQKVVLAKWLIGRKLKILILDHPLRGLDIGAKAEMFALIREFARAGLGVLLIADTVDEVMALSHSIVVMKDGFVSTHFPASAAKPSRLQVLERMV
ncbi:MAG TPA: sugar ABC transporter ATP-binding protein [Bradyrhizobium sp.]|nr:sugar ABC transporter ATP-binding protein [Bradyrhizobium sp.]